MRKFIMGASLCALAVPAVANAADCGEVSITEMNWASASVVTNVAKFVMEQGYGCEVSVIPSDTVPAVTSVAENGEPDIITELWLNSTGDGYSELEAQGKVVRLGKVLDPGGVEGWWIPTYLAEKHPELKTIEGIMANPELVDGRFNNCPEGWGCRVVSDNLIRAFDLESSGLEVFNHGSGETLASSMGSAVQSEEPWFGYYWGPTVPLGKYDMTRVELGEYDQAVHENNMNQEADNPGVSEFPAAPILTAVTSDFQEREPEVAEMMSKLTFKTETMSALLAWKDANNASAEEVAVYYLSNNGDEWTKWLNDSAREQLTAVLN
ncbi:MAG: ABC transporter substrate-binding protein [Oleiphilaceae bacterium]|nr:ABC transporter substrate-binding protein [Oleiphilaceae bacterium]